MPIIVFIVFQKNSFPRDKLHKIKFTTFPTKNKSKMCTVCRVENEFNFVKSTSKKYIPMIAMFALEVNRMPTAVFDFRSIFIFVRTGRLFVFVVLDEVFC